MNEWEIEKGEKEKKMNEKEIWNRKTGEGRGKREDEEERKVKKKEKRTNKSTVWYKVVWILFWNFQCIFSTDLRTYILLFLWAASIHKVTG